MFLVVVKYVKEKGINFYFFGFLFDGGVYSYIEYLYVLLCLVKSEGLEKVYIYGFLDGCDVVF